MSDRNWLIISYSLPAEPSRHRVAVWRRLKKLGAANLQQSLWVLPHSQENYAALREIVSDIESGKGDAMIMESVFSDKYYEEKVVANFNNLRDEEYGEFIHECDKYLAEIDKEISIEKFTFAELEEEEELNKLVSWYHKIAARDIFNASAGNSAAMKLEQITSAFEKYNETVYNVNEQ